ncbi:sigma 54-interacting transcriptional regulator [Shewanella surugensis]|uniref:Sigma-54 dependent transcriptional regulator n=1 Tax=Shewanella surugensis TaxID=212020 RepID=A0ABT0LFH7_9GAMM|nr:sigma-54 dependent transcriptional regulator [Shewanella surugensis]MCL1126100.1 sigma-54 dependent transcriptional regulator [Shewanella surugensis]
MTYQSSPTILPGIIGNAASIHALASQIGKIAVTDCPVLLKGETGTGKELFANAIHQLSDRKGEMIAVNCSAIPEHLFESLLFGHEKGAFTGADKNHDGFFAQAHNGTLFFDEIAELPLVHQPKLLRVLESKYFCRIGSSEKRHFTGRIISATHQNMSQRVKDKAFREDLFYRLNLFELTIPSLAQRREDIPLLVHYFSKQHKSMTFSQCAMDLFKYAVWPGNIRQLKNTIDKLVILADDDYLSAQCIHALSVCEADPDVLSKLAREIIELPIENKIKAIYDALVEAAMDQSGGNKTKAATLLGVHRKVIERRLHQITATASY